VSAGLIDISEKHYIKYQPAWQEIVDFSPRTSRPSAGAFTAVRLTLAVIAERSPKQAIVYFGANAGPGVARPAYLAEVLAPARSWPLPAEGVEALERIARQ
jgi:hypothetical protein